MLGLAQTQTLTPASQRPLAHWTASRHSLLVTYHCLNSIASETKLKGHATH
jgi:hypothetical protein